jgi:2-dehydropantoate 2-reductase
LVDVKVTVIGAGGVGGYFGGRLLQAGVDVTFVARGAHVDALKAHGLHVRSVRGDFTVPVRATDDPGSSRAADYVLVSVKSYDTDRVASMLGSLLGDDTAVVSLQNGVDNEERLAAVLGDDRVVGAPRTTSRRLPHRVSSTTRAARRASSSASGAAATVSGSRHWSSRSERPTSPPTTRRTSVRCCGAELSGQN